ncbi:dihydrolipoyl dehydrogenase family protein [Citreimonas salinaria]|uniref:Pyruvate/2-oxoglutarate dehydrogenase complex, dihydrolipoamide dehydrogenase (E3) component n=1 Tax=Citreimonas salinaria TaxID=321339 RepID=A0A1H3KIQ3_9RHOB|nr:FAD-dependent oxidoreductase [Citreimonas salinaria]SDY51996.1 Pyruvate/2-oxoglutarate dehydrogenase complex, dihydrolipoamide dehydrogenase (E3) component [Citreimonas salinaria]
MEDIKTDVVILGAGSGGLSVAAGAAQMGAHVTLLEPGEMGGDCLNYGCVPSKALIAAASVAHSAFRSDDFGISTGAPQVDYAAVMDHVKRAQATIAPHDSQERFEKMGVCVIREAGRFVSDDEIQTDRYRIKTRRIVIATGSRPLVPPIDGLEDVPYLTNETLWDLRERPEHLLIIGGGPIGIEMAQAHRRLGCAVTVIEGSRALGKDDPEFAALLLDRLRAEGIEIVEGAQAKSARHADGRVVLETDDGKSFEGSHLLVAVGRKANTEALDLDRAGIATTRSGVQVDERLRTTNRRVFAIGDAAGGLQFTHVAGYHAGIVVRQVALGLPAKAKTDHLPWTTYTRPELAHVGLTEKEAREKHGDSLRVVRLDFDQNDRAVTEGETEGMIKVMVVRGRPVGASIVGAQAGDLIALWSLAIANGLRMSQISSMVAPYPTLAEINKRVAGAYYTPTLFENDTVKRLVRLVQRRLP